MVEEYLKERRKRSGDLFLASEPLSANQYEDCLIEGLRREGLSEERILQELKNHTNLQTLLGQIVRERNARI